MEYSFDETTANPIAMEAAMMGDWAVAQSRRAGVEGTRQSSGPGAAAVNENDGENDNDKTIPSRLTRGSLEVGTKTKQQQEHPQPRPVFHRLRVWRGNVFARRSNLTVPGGCGRGHRDQRFLRRGECYPSRCS